MHVNPYLFFNGRTEEALAFYSKAIGAKVGMMMRFGEGPDQNPNCTPPDKNKIMHADFKVGDTMIFVSDGMAQGKLNFDGFSLAIAADDKADCEKKFNALAEGGEIAQPLTETFFAHSFGMVKDKYGVHWMLIVSKQPRV